MIGQNKLTQIAAAVKRQGGGGELTKVYATWDPNYKDVGDTLSNGDLSSTGSQQTGLTRATIGSTVDKYYFEINVAAASNSFIGVVDASKAATSDVFEDSAGGVYDGGVHKIIINGGYGGNIPDFTDANTLSFAVDPATREFWFAIDGVWVLSGDPANGINAAGTLNGAGAIYPAVTPWGTVTANFGASAFAHTVPAGFNAGVYTEEPPAGAYVPPNLAVAVFDGVIFDASAQDTVLRGLTFKPDGTKMYLVGGVTGTVYQYTLSTAWDVSTATYDTVSILAQDTSPVAVAFNTDGTKMYTAGYTGDKVYQYTLSTAWDVSSATYDTVSLSVIVQDSNPRGLFFSADGLKLYHTGFSDKVYQYTLSTAWDLSTATYDSISYVFLAYGSDPESLFFSADGSKMYVITSQDDVLQFSTASAPLAGPYRYLRCTFDTGYQLNGIRGLSYVQANADAHPDAAMTSNVLPVPLVAEASSGAVNAYTAFDSLPNTTSSFTSYSDGAWLQIDLGSEVFDPAGGHILVNASTTAYGYVRVRSVEASNTGVFEEETVVLWSGNQTMANSVETQIDFTV